jgi:haloalkane dehalogenase
MSIDPQIIHTHTIDCLDSYLHYYHSPSSGNIPIVCIHGMPVSGYVWRNIMPSLSKIGPVYAPDLIGMGRSGRPNVAYSFFDHVRYFEAFMKALDIKNCILVLHGWGSVIGFDYASQHPEQIKGLAFYEPHLRVTKQVEQLSLPVQEMLHALNDPIDTEQKIMKDNYFIETLMADASMDRLPKAVIDEYRLAFQTPESRQVLWQFFQELPVRPDISSAVKDRIEVYSQFLQTTNIPKCLLYALPGFITTMQTVNWANHHLPELSSLELGYAYHFAQESIPDAFSHLLTAWCQSVVNQVEV